MLNSKKASILVMAAVIVSLAGCSSVGTTMPVTPGHELQPLSLGWQRYFEIDWQQGERHGMPILSGRVENKYGEAATRGGRHSSVQQHVLRGPGGGRVELPCERLRLRLDRDGRAATLIGRTRRRPPIPASDRRSGRD